MHARGAKCDLGKVLLQSVHEMKAGRRGRVHKAGKGVTHRGGPDKGRVVQAQFAQLLGVSVRTLQGWEQGRREPPGAAKRSFVSQRVVPMCYAPWRRDGS